MSIVATNEKILRTNPSTSGGNTYIVFNRQNLAVRCTCYIMDRLIKIDKGIGCHHFCKWSYDHNVDTKIRYGYSNGGWIADDYLGDRPEYKPEG